MDLKTYLTTDPDNLGFAPLILAGNDGEIAALINTQGTKMLRTRIISARGVLSDYAGGPAAAADVLDKLETLSASVPAIRWVMTFLKAEGVDIGHPATQGMLDQLAAGGALTKAEAKNLQALGFATCSWGEKAGLGNVSDIAIRKVIWNDDGTRAI